MKHEHSQSRCEPASATHERTTYDQRPFQEAIFSRAVNPPVYGTSIRIRGFTASSRTRFREPVVDQTHEAHDPPCQYAAPRSRSSRIWDGVVGAIPLAVLAIGGIIVADEYYDLKILSGLGIEYEFFGADIKMRWLERRVWAAARAADDDQCWRGACLAAAKVRLARQRFSPVEEIDIPSKSTGWWGGGRKGDVLDGEDVKLFLVRDESQVVPFFCIVMNADLKDPDIRAKE